MTSNHQPIPRYETEIIKAEANKHWHGDTEKTATTSAKQVCVDGVHLISRYDKADEYELMRSMICALTREAFKPIQSIFCESKLGHSYIVLIQPWDEQLAYEILGTLDAVAISQAPYGHNGLWVAADDGTCFGDHERQVGLDNHWPWLDLDDDEEEVVL